MGVFREYILNVIGVSLISGILLQITANCQVRKSIHLLTGIVLTVTICAPLKKIEIKEFKRNNTFQEDGLYYSQNGIDIAVDGKSHIIMESCESYILRRAEALGIQIDVEVDVDENQIPVAVKITGSVSPYVQKEFSEILEKEMGITKEHQQWTG